MTEVVRSNCVEIHETVIEDIIAKMDDLEGWCGALNTMSSSQDDIRHVSIRLIADAMSDLLREAKKQIGYGDA